MKVLLKVFRKLFIRFVFNFIDMNIGFDAKRIFYNQTGLGNYSRDTVRILYKFYPENSYFLFNPKPAKNHLFLTDKPAITEINPDSVFYKKMPSLWRTGPVTKSISKNGIQIYHGLTNELPFGIHKLPVKTVVSIHDLIFLRFPELYPLVDRNIYRLKFKYACGVADKIIAISQQTKADIINYFGVDEKKISVIYQGCHPVFQQPRPPEELQQIKNKHGLPEKYILNVGTIEKRKNLLSLVKAIKPLKDAKLVIVGKKTDYAEAVFKYVGENQMTDRVFHLQNVDLNDLAGIYQNAAIFAYPSIFEGFGIPILEALFSKVPVITSTGSCFAETGGPESIYVDPYNVKNLTAAISSIWENSEKKKRMAEKGFQFVQKFTDSEIAANLMNMYTDLLAFNLKKQSQ